jgi:hypothetical protein
VKGGISVDANASDLRDGEILSLVYVNSSHEYVVFDPHKNEELVSSKHKARRIQAEESGEFFFCYLVIFFCLNVLLYFLSFSLLHVDTANVIHTNLVRLVPLLYFILLFAR